MDVEHFAVYFKYTSITTKKSILKVYLLHHAFLTFCRYNYLYREKEVCILKVLSKHEFCTFYSFLSTNEHFCGSTQKLVRAKISTNMVFINISDNKNK